MNSQNKVGRLGNGPGGRNHSQPPHASHSVPSQNREGQPSGLDNFTSAQKNINGAI